MISSQDVLNNTNRLSRNHQKINRAGKIRYSLLFLMTSGQADGGVSIFL